MKARTAPITTASRRRGGALRFTSCDIFRVRDGRIVEHWGMGDIAGVLAQLRG